MHHSCPEYVEVLPVDAHLVRRVRAPLPLTTLSTRISDLHFAPMEIANDAGEEEQQPDQQQQEPEEAEEEEEHMGVGTAVEVEALHGVPGGRKSRPCKAKRDRYRKLVCKLMAEAGAEPGNFDFSRCQLPPSVAEDEVLKHKLRHRLEKDVQGLLAGAGADDGQSSMANSAASLAAAAVEAVAGSLRPWPRS